MKEWRGFAIDHMHLGDRPAAMALNVAKRMVAEAGWDIYPESVEMIEHDYVDDGYGRGCNDDVLHLMGETVDEHDVISYQGTIPLIMT